VVLNPAFAAWSQLAEAVQGSSEYCSLAAELILPALAQTVKGAQPALRDDVPEQGLPLTAVWARPVEPAGFVLAARDSPRQLAAVVVP